MVENVRILPIDPESFKAQAYDEKDLNLISIEDLDTSFDEKTDYIEHYVFDESQNLISPNDLPLQNYSIRDGHVYVDPQQDLENFGFDEGNYFVNYYFYRNQANSSYNKRFYISEINSDRINELIKNNIISGGMIPKIKICLVVASNGVKGVCIIDGRLNHSILFELLSDKGSGTLIRSWTLKKKNIYYLI